MLNHFNPALVDNLAPEYSPTRAIHSFLGSGVRGVIFEYEQKDDFRRGLLFAESLIHDLKYLKKIPVITQERLEVWIIYLHKIVAHGLMKEWQGQSGIYNKDILFYRREGLSEFFEEFEAHFRKDWSNVEIRSNTLKEIFRRHNQLRLFATWNELILKFDNKKYKLPREWIIKGAEQNKHYRLLNVLAYVKNNKNLSKRQKFAIKELYRIVYPMKDGFEMKKFTQTLIEKILQCNSENLNQIYKLAAECFRDFTQLNPFPNGNYRIANILTNIILILFNQPTILFKEDNDRVEANQFFQKIILEMDSNIQPLINFIKKKVGINRVKPEDGTLDSFSSSDNRYIFRDYIVFLAKKYKAMLIIQDNKIDVANEKLENMIKRTESLNNIFKQELDELVYNIDPTFIIQLKNHFTYTKEDLNKAREYRIKRLISEQDLLPSDFESLTITENKLK